MADRVGIIREGNLVTVESVQSLRSKAIRRVDLYFEESVEASVFEQISGVRSCDVTNHHASLSFDGHMDELLSVAAKKYSLADINTQEEDLEEIFLTYYQDEV